MGSCALLPAGLLLEPLSCCGGHRRLPPPWRRAAFAHERDGVPRHLFVLFAAHQVVERYAQHIGEPRHGIEGALQLLPTHLPPCAVALQPHTPDTED